MNKQNTLKHTKYNISNWVTLITITKRCTSQINAQSYLNLPLSQSFINFRVTFSFYAILEPLSVYYFPAPAPQICRRSLTSSSSTSGSSSALASSSSPSWSSPLSTSSRAGSEHHHRRHHHFRHHHLRRHHPTQEVRSDLETFRAVVPHATVACQTSHKKSLIVQGGGRPDDKDFSQPDPGGGP